MSRPTIADISNMQKTLNTVMSLYCLLGSYCCMVMIVVVQLLLVRAHVLGNYWS